MSTEAPTDESGNESNLGKVVPDSLAAARHETFGAGTDTFLRPAKVENTTAENPGHEFGSLSRPTAGKGVGARL